MTSHEPSGLDTTTTTTTTTHLPTVAATTRFTPTATDCYSFTLEPVVPAPQLLFALPPNTTWNELGSTAGANMVLACIPRTNPEAIDAFLTTKLAQAG